MLTVPIRDRLKRTPRLYWALRRTRAAVREVLPPVRLPGVPGRVHRNDTMIPKHTAEHAPGYSWRGHQASEFVADAVAQAGFDDQPAEAIDFGCGYGGVLRHLVSRLPTTRWTACDIEPQAVRFCAREFGAVPIVSSTDIGSVQFETAPYDLVWMGSLLTHLDADNNAAVLDALARHTRSRCVIVFSTHGPGLTSYLDSFGPGLGEQRAEVESELATTGFAYVPYPHYADGSYGIAFHSAICVERIVRTAFGGAVERLQFGERAWMDHHDLHAFVVTQSPAE